MGKKRKHRKDLPQRVYCRKGVYYYCPKNPDKKKWINLGSDLPKALLKYGAMVDRFSSSKSTETVIDRYLSDVAINRADKTYKDYSYMAVRLKAVFGGMPIDEITIRHAYEYQDRRSKKTIFGANRELSLLNDVMSKSVRWGLITANPLRDLEYLKEPKRERYITDDELKILRAAAGDKICCIIDLAYLTSCRISDILKIQLADIKEEGLFIQQKKTGKKQLFKANDVLLEVIARAKALPRPVLSLYLFSTQKGRLYTYANFYASWKKVVAATGLRGVHFHDLRAKALTDTKTKTGSTGEAQLLAGHMAEATTERYVKKFKVTEVETKLKIDE